MQVHFLTKNFGKYDTSSIGSYMNVGGFEALRKAVTMDPEKTKAIMDSVRTETEKLESLGKNPIIITSPIVRMYFKKLTEDYFKDLIVVSYNEVESDVELQSVGMVTA